MKKSFSSLVKDELCSLNIKNKNYASSELAAILIFGENADINKVVIKSARAQTLARIQSLVKRIYDYDISIDVIGSGKSYSISLNTDLTEEIGLFFSENGDIEIDEDLFSDDECKKAFLRGAFIIGGTISAPEKTYSCELLTYNKNVSVMTEEILTEFGIHSNTTKRKELYVTYLKDSASVSDFLNIIGAHNNMMSLMMTQIEKDVSNQANRQMNCKIANLDKTITASAMQCKAIEKIKNSPKWNFLNEEMKELGTLRLHYTDASLTELGEKMNPKLSKSAVNRRMKKFIEMADED